MLRASDLEPPSSCPKRNGCGGPIHSRLTSAHRFVSCFPWAHRCRYPGRARSAIHFPEKSAFFTGAFAVFGSFERQSFSVASTRVDVARVGPRPTDDTFGAGSSVLLLPSPDATVDQLEADWVAVHELSHLWLPHLYPRGRWISEGIATYLQEVLRARCGLQTGKQAWTSSARGLRARSALGDWARPGQREPRDSLTDHVGRP